MRPEDLPTPSSEEDDSPVGLTPSSTGQTAYSQLEWDEISATLGTGPVGATNAWVVSDDHPESGMPLLANDIHLGIQLPSVWYQIGLHCVDGDDPAFDVVGFTFPVSLGIVIGHNGSIAWGISNGFPDVHDAYRLRINPENSLQYEPNGQWRDMTVREESIRFGDGSEPVMITVRESHLGPITTDNRLETGTRSAPHCVIGTFPPSTSSTPISLGTSVTSWPGAFRFAPKITTASRRAQAGPAITSGKVFFRIDVLPHILNPVGGIVVVTNYVAVPLSYYEALAANLGRGFNYTISRDMDYAYRAARIEQLLAATPLHSIESFQQIQDDMKLLSADEILPYLGNIRLPDDELR